MAEKIVNTHYSDVTHKMFSQKVSIFSLHYFKRNKFQVFIL